MAGLCVRQRPKSPHGEWTGLHEAAERGHAPVVRILLDAGAGVNAREAGDNTYALHWAAAHRHLDTVRALVDAGGDVHGAGDDHKLDVIGQKPGDKPEVAHFLAKRGARHHIFPAIALGDMDAVREVIARDPAAFTRRRSRFEGEMTALHLAAKLGRDEILGILIEAGAIEAGAAIEDTDVNGHTAMESAMLPGNSAAVKRLKAAGAKEPAAAAAGARLRELGKSVKRLAPMIPVPDIAATLDWYKSIGFDEVSRYSDGALVTFGMVRYGSGQILINGSGKAGDHDTTLW